MTQPKVIVPKIIAPKIIAMWSGPRTISTAMMRAFENRTDTEVWDEPFYGYYLQQTGLPHPGAAEVIAHHGADWRDTVSRCTRAGPQQRPVFYQKHMTLHLLPGIDRDWLGRVANCFLLRQPRQVVASYGAIRTDLTLADLGFVQQVELFRLVRRLSGAVPPVIDSHDFLLNPDRMLQKLCACLGLEFQPGMLHWPAGQRDSDGVWGKYWYHRVWQSTGFGAHPEAPPELRPAAAKIAAEAQPYYDLLYRHRLIA